MNLKKCFGMNLHVNRSKHQKYFWEPLADVENEFIGCLVTTLGPLQDSRMVAW